MSKEMEYFIFLLEQYARYKSSTANNILEKWDALNITQKIFDSYWRYHTEAIENAFAEIDKWSEK